jgi:hypothetical protein
MLPGQVMLTYNAITGAHRRGENDRRILIEALRLYECARARAWWHRLWATFPTSLGHIALSHSPNTPPEYAFGTLTLLSVIHYTGGRRLGNGKSSGDRTRRWQDEFREG